MNSLVLRREHCEQRAVEANANVVGQGNMIGFESPFADRTASATTQIHSKTHLPGIDMHRIEREVVKRWDTGKRARIPAHLLSRCG
ncbi:hypothetical protein BC937DRAFT_90309 [Endogone sp. FLAS-F59071]|nr:hypothetical protein BC937DRAFT_90309 [Endogone sp. FLAS-F59071]|eukprot:RUS17167.1 hypothetical protein BC937DRAFT_90309 [Endogone sp. FLAS-F59071]